MDGTLCFGVYDDVTLAILRFETTNPGQKKIRLTVSRTARPDAEVERDARNPSRVDINTPASGSIEIEADGEINMPAGMSYKMETVPVRSR